ncbi:RdRp [Giant panda associated partiti-like virus]|nr:RdRp [Giant panda associated partiti-like virus]
MEHSMKTWHKNLDKESSREDDYQPVIYTLSREIVRERSTQLNLNQEVTSLQEGPYMWKTVPYKLAALREWNLRMSRSETPEIFDPVVAHVLREQGFEVDSKKYYEPRSVYSVEKFFEQLQSFNPSKSVFVDVKDRHVQRGIAFAYKVFGKGKDDAYLEPLELWDESIISNWKGSAGVTAYGQTKREAFSRGILSAKRILGQDGLARRKPEPCLGLTRTGKNGKSRLIWGYPMSMTLIEGSLAKPLLGTLTGLNTPMAYKLTNKTLGMKILAASQTKKWYYSLDATQFDSSIQKIMIEVAFSIIATHFDRKAMYDDVNTVGEVLELVRDYFIHTPIVMPAGEKAKGNVQGVLYYGKKHGVPSGSYFTQLVDSIVNIIVLGTLASKFGFYLSKEEIFVLGDDLLFFTNTHLDVKKPSTSYAKSTFGMLLK